MTREHRLRNDYMGNQILRETTDLIESFREYDQHVYNTISIEEFRRKWLPAFHDYFYEVKDENGKLKDELGEVMTFWNRRQLPTGGAANMMLDTHVLNAQGKAMYIIPSTLTPITTILPNETVPTLFALITEAISSPIPAARAEQTALAIRFKFSNRTETFTDAYRKHLILNHLFVSEGYPPLLPDAEVTPKDVKETVSTNSYDDEIDFDSDFDIE